MTEEIHNYKGGNAGLTRPQRCRNGLDGTSAHPFQLNAGRRI